MADAPVVRDLGRLDGDVLVFGGCYSNLQATQALLSEAEARGIAADHMICTGDAVGYCADAWAVARLVRDKECAVIAGNVEKQLAAEADDCGCGFSEGSVCDRLSASWFAHASAQIDPESRRWMSDLPDLLTFRHGGRRNVVVHGAISDIAKFVWPVTSDVDLIHEFDLATSILGPVDAIIAGHSGIAFEREVDGKQWINAGAIGLPPHDGRAMTRFAVLTGRGARIERLDHDAEAAAATMRAAGLPAEYTTALRTGLWPSEDILPPELRRVQDRASG